VTAQSPRRRPARLTRWRAASPASAAAVRRRAGRGSCVSRRQLGGLWRVRWVGRGFARDESRWPTARVSALRARRLLPLAWRAPAACLSAAGSAPGRRVSSARTPRRLAGAAPAGWCSARDRVARLGGSYFGAGKRPPFRTARGEPRRSMFRACPPKVVPYSGPVFGTAENGVFRESRALASGGSAARCSSVGAARSCARGPASRRQRVSPAGV